LSLSDAITGAIRFNAGQVLRVFRLVAQILHKVFKRGDGEDGDAVGLLHFLHGGQGAAAAFLPVEGDDDTDGRGAQPL
jgi:hypothetical protein